MKKILSICLLIVLLMAGLSACNNASPSGDYLLLEAVHTNCNLLDNTKDFWSSDTYKLYANGKMEIVSCYNLSEDKTTYIYLSSDEVSDIAKLIRSQKLTPDNNDGADGTQWDITYYEKNGKVGVDYKGYVYEGKLRELVMTLITAQENSAPKNAFFTAHNYFVGLNESTGKETWFSGDWTIFYDGKVIYTYTAGDMDDSVTVETTIDEKTMNEIRDLISEQEKTTHDDLVLDADEWTFNYFDKDGKTLKHFNGVVYEFDNLTKLADIIAFLGV